MFQDFKIYTNLNDNIQKFSRQVSQLYKTMYINVQFILVLPSLVFYWL